MSPLLYIFFALLVAAAGINRAIGFWGYLALSLLLTPIGGLLILWLSKDRRKLDDYPH